MPSVSREVRPDVFRNIFFQFVALDGYMLGKIPKAIREIERGNENAENLLTVREKSNLEIITRMYRQQKNHFRNNDSR